MNIEFIVYVFICIIENTNQNYSRIPCFVEMNIKTTTKYVVYQNTICGFLQVPIAPLILPKIVCLRMSFFFKTSPFGQSQVSSS